MGRICHTTGLLYEITTCLLHLKLTTDSDINHNRFLKFPNYCLNNKFKIQTVSKAVAQPKEELCFLCFVTEVHQLSQSGLAVKTHHTWTEQRSSWGQKMFTYHKPQRQDLGVSSRQTKKKKRHFSHRPQVWARENKLWQGGMCWILQVQRCCLSKHKKYSNKTSLNY